MTRLPKDGGVQNPERRNMLRLLAHMPRSLSESSEREADLSLPVPEVLSLCAAQLDSGWQQSKGRDLTGVGVAALSTLPILTTLAREASPYQREAAALASQAFMLTGLMSRHLGGLISDTVYYSKAVEYSQLAEDINLQADSWRWLAYSYSCSRHYQKALEICNYALSYANDLAPLVRSVLSLDLAKYQARCGLQQDALSSLELANEAFMLQAELHKSFPYTLHDNFTLLLGVGETYFYLGRRDKIYLTTALRTFQEVIGEYDQETEAFTGGLWNDEPVPERIRLEFLNNLALTTLRLRDLEQSSFYLLAAVQGAHTLGSEQRYNEAHEIYQIMEHLWDDEPRIRELEEFFRK